MKRCPECRRDYYDETLLYCLDDGTALLEGPGTLGGGLTDEPRTAILRDTDPPSEVSTRQELHTKRDEAAVKGFDKRLVLVPLCFMVVVLGFFAYRYFSP